MPRSKYSAIEKLALIDEFEASGQTYKDFVKAHGLSSDVIQRW